MDLYCLNMKAHLMKQKTIIRYMKIKCNLNNQEFLQKSLTWPDVLSRGYQTGPLGASDSTGTVTEPRIVLFHTMSQSYIVTFI
jgi:hypothetical protein